MGDKPSRYIGNTQLAMVFVLNPIFFKKTDLPSHLAGPFLSSLTLPVASGGPSPRVLIDRMPLSYAVCSCHSRAFGIQHCPSVPEDRALLGSNLSAVPDAERKSGPKEAYFPPLAPMFTAFCSKASNPGVRGSAPAVSLPLPAVESHLPHRQCPLIIPIITGL
jgi:hypothetical protein